MNSSKGKKKCGGCGSCRNCLLLRYYNGRSSEWNIPHLSMAVSSSRVSMFNAQDGSSTTEAVGAMGGSRDSIHTPMLCSHCPGIKKSSL